MHRQDSDVLLHPFVDAQSEPLACASCTRPLLNNEVTPDPQPHDEFGYVVSVDIRFLCSGCWALVRKETG